MKISIVVPSFYPATVYGGPIFSILHTCEALSQYKDLDIFVSTTNANRFNRLKVEKNKWVKFKDNFYVKYYNETIVGQGQFSISLFLSLWRDIKTSDLVHVQGIFNTPIPIAIICSKIFKKPLIISPRGSFLDGARLHGSRLKELWRRLFIDYVGNNIVWHATSEDEKNGILKLYPKSRVIIITNGVSIKDFSNVNYYSNSTYVKKFTGKLLNPSKIIVSMARLHKQKGFDVLINAFSKIKNRHTDAILMIAGVDVGEKDNLIILRDSLNLKDSIFFVGEVSNQDKIDFLGNADLFVLPSLFENFGNVYLESLASGTPIIASKKTPWSIIEGENCGKWVERDEVNMTKAILEMLLKDRQEMKINSRKLAKNYDWVILGRSFKKVYKEMIS
jgi:glycosyltransferase involved in cell wall biosynthesis